MNELQIRVEAVIKAKEIVISKVTPQEVEEVYGEYFKKYNDTLFDYLMILHELDTETAKRLGKDLETCSNEITKHLESLGLESLIYKF